MKETEPVVDCYYTYMSTWNSPKCPVQFMAKEKEALSKHDLSHLSEVAMSKYKQSRAPGALSLQSL